MIFTKHIVFYSGGIGSWATAKRVIAKHGKENVILLFTDTLIEDEDLYRFIDETVAEMGCEYYRVADGRTPFEVYKDVRFLGNSRLAPCSHKLKQEPAKKWITANFAPDQCVLYLGIDWTEEHRTAAPRRNWAPYSVEFPMCEEPYVDKAEMIAELERLGIKQPRLYAQGYSHNNCSGGCCRAGQGHWAHVLDTRPEVFAKWESMEEDMRQHLDKDISMLKRIRKGVTYPLTLRQLREELQAKQTEQIDFDDIGGCGCFVQDEES